MNEVAELSISEYEDALAGLRADSETLGHASEAINELIGELATYVTAVYSEYSIPPPSPRLIGGRGQLVRGAMNRYRRSQLADRKSH